MGDGSDIVTEQERLRALRRHLVEICDREGPMSFARYMEICLYHPQLGYYTAGPPPVGQEGDFVTYPSAHPAFGRLLARQVRECWDAMGRPSPFAFVEVGGGRGTLARDLLEFIRVRVPELWDALDPILVDESHTLRGLQELATASFGRIRILDPATFFEQTPPLTGFILSNELVDALPVHIVEQRDGTIREVFVRVSDESIEEVLVLPSDPRITGFLKALDAELLEGQRTEIHLAAVDWIRRVAQVMEKGVLVTIDFGYNARELFHPCRSRGTLMAYKRHFASADPYELPGGQDLCAHVNFSALVWAGEQAGLELTGLVTQDRFLLRLGLLEELEAQEARREQMNPVDFWKEKLSLRQLMMPQSAAGGFQVLVQHKGWAPPALAGLS